MKSLAALVLMGASFLSAQVPAPEPSPVALEVLVRSVVFLTGPEAPITGKGLQAGPVVHIGTGFLVAVKDTVCLVTAEHVASLLRTGAGLTIASLEGKPVTFSLASLVGGEKRVWTTHPTADVAAIILSPSAEVLKELQARALAPSLLTSHLEAPSRSRPVTVVGFPLGLGVVITGPDGRLSPISRESKAVSGLLTIRRFDTKVPAVFFLLDSPSIGGLSGSPVFVTGAPYSEGASFGFPNNTLLVGLVHGTLNDAKEGRLTAIVPSAEITSTIERALQTYESSRFRLFP